MLERAGPARGDHRHVHGVRHRARELQLVAVLGAVAVHAREEDLPRPALDALARPLHGVAAHRRAPAVHVHLVAVPGLARGRRSRAPRTGRRTPRASSPSSSGRATAAEFTDTLSAPASSTAWASSTERTPPPIVNGMNTSSAHAARQRGHRLALLVRGRDVEEHDLVGALVLVAHRQLHRVPGVADVHELHALDHAALVHVEAGDHARAAASAASSSTAWPSADGEAPLVQRLAGDHAREVDEPQLPQRPQVVERADPARVDEAPADHRGDAPRPRRGRARRASRRGPRSCRRTASRRAAACARSRPRRGIWVSLVQPATDTWPPRTSTATTTRTPQPRAPRSRQRRVGVRGRAEHHARRRRPRARRAPTRASAARRRTAPARRARA